MSDNVIKSTDLNPKKTTKKTTASKVNDNTIVPKASAGKKLIYFSSGSAYVTKSGFRFSKEKRIYEIDEEEANFLLTLDNFRLPDQVELEDYYKENN